MGLEVVTNEIKMMGDKEANKIKIDAENKAKTIIADATKQATEIIEIAKRESKSQKERIVIREVSAANLIVKRDLLNAQKELLDKVYSQTSKEISKLPIEVHEKAIRYLLKSAVSQIKKGVIYSNKRDKKIVESAISELQTLSGFKFGEVIDMDGGIIVKSLDGQYTIDYSYKTFLDEIWESNVKNASEILFNDNS